MSGSAAQNMEPSPVVDQMGALVRTPFAPESRLSRAPASPRMPSTLPTDHLRRSMRRALQRVRASGVVPRVLGIWRCNVAKRSQSARELATDARYAHGSHAPTPHAACAHKQACALAACMDCMDCMDTVAMLVLQTTKLIRAAPRCLVST